jgi:uncharacterized caspase-like protein
MKKYLLFIATIFLSLFILSSEAQTKLYAVCVGVSQYEQPRYNLLYSHKDAIEMYNMLSLYAPANRVKLLVNEQATRDNIIEQTDELFAQTMPEDVVIFFFSGHGEVGCFVTYDKLLLFRDLQRIFKKTRAKRKLIFADACYSGTLRTPPTNSTNTSSAALGSNVLLFLSSRSDQSSLERSRLKDGVFTYFLLAGLRGGADANKDCSITAIELFNFVNPKVKQYSNERQTPVMWGKFDENMVILEWEPQEDDNSNTNY